MIANPYGRVWSPEQDRQDQMKRAAYEVETGVCWYCNNVMNRDHPKRKPVEACKDEWMRRKYAELGATAMMFYDDCDDIDLEAIDNARL